MNSISRGPQNLDDPYYDLMRQLEASRGDSIAFAEARQKMMNFVMGYDVEKRKKAQLKEAIDEREAI